MKTSLFKPEKIKVGYQKRDNTYTKKLAYVTYFDNEGILRKEKSWNDWRDDKIPTDEFENVPTEGFVLNKSVGGKGGGWDNRQAYIRIYDPRGFEFEITLENLLFILEHNNCIKGKGLEGEYVYVWNGVELFLMPTIADIYKDVVIYNDILKKGEYIDVKDLQVGYTYSNKKNEQFVYLGQHEKFDDYNQSLGNYFWFAWVFDNDKWFYIQNFKNVKNKFIEITSTVLPVNYKKMENDLLRADGYKTKKLNFVWEELNIPFKDLPKAIDKNYLYVFFEDKYRYVSYKREYSYEEGGYIYHYEVEGKNKKYQDLETFRNCKFYKQKCKKDK